MPDDGARSAQEAALPSSAADTELNIIGQAEAGGRYGLDEAELARQRPLDGKAWDGDPNEPLLPETAQDDQALRAARSSEPDSSEP